MDETADMSDVSDTETLCTSEISDVSDAQTLNDLPINDLLEFPVPYPLSAPHEPYLTQNRYNEFEAWKRRNPGQRKFLPPPYSIEFSFRDFTSALGRTYLTAQQSPPSRTTSGTFAEFTAFAKKLRFNLTLTVPPTQTAEQAGNIVEIRRMLFTALIKFAEVWQDTLPDGVEKKQLYEDIVRFILKSAGAQRLEDSLRGLGREVGPYRVERYSDACWKEVMEKDLAHSKWKGWKDGAL
ncbi:hypothetical protein PQX77_008918 [Marasmius sp. AFHP31]|nr:hypothetical protein PQX77_008918 [Marasmius sp. AFHP31]